MTTTALCVRGCTSSRHRPQCTDDTCRGCQPQPTAPGLLVCADDVQVVRVALRPTRHPSPDERGKRVPADSLGIPDLWDAVSDAGVMRARAAGGSGGGRPIPLDADAAAWRTRVRTFLVAWCRTLEDDFGVSLDGAEDAVPWMCRRIAWHADRLLAHPDHADQLVADLDGWAEDDGPRHEGLLAEGRRLAFRARGHAVRIRCGCGTWVPVELEEDGRVDTGAIITCRGCGEYGTLDWWRRREAPSPDPLPLRLLPDWLLTVHGLSVPLRRLRDLADRGEITTVERKGDGPGRPSRRYDPVAVAAVIMSSATPRKTG